jgi:hypothetical protein
MPQEDDVPDEADEVGPDLAREPTATGVRYLLGLGMTEMDARDFVAVAKGKLTGDARAVDDGAKTARWQCPRDPSSPRRSDGDYREESEKALRLLQRRWQAA